MGYLLRTNAPAGLCYLIHMDTAIKVFCIMLRNCAYFWEEEGYELIENNWYKDGKHKFSFADGLAQYNMSANGEKVPF